MTATTTRTTAKIRNNHGEDNREKDDTIDSIETGYTDKIDNNGSGCNDIQ